MVELKRCPFCGGEVTLVEADEDFLYSEEYNPMLEVYIQCSSCHLSSHLYYEDAKENLIKAWTEENQRG